RLSPESAAFLKNGWLIIGGKPETRRTLFNRWDDLEIVLNLLPDKTIVFAPLDALRKEMGSQGYDFDGVAALPDIAERRLLFVAAHEPVHSIFHRLPEDAIKRMQQALARAPEDLGKFGLQLTQSAPQEAVETLGDLMSAWIHYPEVMFLDPNAQKSPSLPTFWEVLANNVFSWKDQAGRRFLRLYWPQNQ